MIFGDHGEQQNGDGAGQGVGKKDKGERHAGEHAVHAQGGDIVIAVGAQHRGDGDGLHALKEIEDDAVCGERKRHGEKAAVQPGGERGGNAAAGSLHGSEGEQHGAELSEGKTEHGNADGRCLARAESLAGDEKHTADSCQLLEQLGGGRNTGFFDSVKVAVDTGVYST